MLTERSVHRGRVWPRKRALDEAVADGSAVKIWARDTSMVSGRGGFAAENVTVNVARC